MKRAALAAAAAIAVVVACSPIEGTPLSSAPINTCPAQACEAYVAKTGPRTKAQCNDGRCAVGVGLPVYPITMVVDVPDTSFYAPGRAFVLTRDELSPPSGTPVPRLCVPPRCVQLPLLVSGEGRYRVTTKAATDVGFPQHVPEGTSVPARASFVRLIGSTGSASASSIGLPLEPSFAFPRIVQRPGSGVADILYSNSVAVGRYARVLTPEPPYDAYFPPISNVLPVGDAFIDEVVLGDTKTPLDDPTGDLRRATLTRAEGLDGWKTWLADSDSGQRLSVVRPLSGARSVVRLDTVGASAASSGALREGVDIVMAPPEGTIAVPLLRSRLFLTGTDLGTTEYPKLPSPVAVSGVVALETDSVLNGVPSRIVFTSTQIRLADGSQRSFLRYETFVSTDGSGRFATVLPLGVYEVTVEPAEGTGRARARVEQSLEINRARADLQLRPSLPRTKVTGTALLTDTRPLAGAEVRAVPVPSVATGVVTPRPGRARVADDGSFALELDPGQYDVVVEPQAGSGFPRVVTPANVQGETADLGTIEVPPPTRLSITLRDPNPNLAGNPIVRAVVRVYAPRVDGSQLVEIGRAMTNESGQCEILLAQQPR